MRARVITVLLGVPFLIVIVAFGRAWHLFSFLIFLVTIGTLGEYFNMAFPRQRRERILGKFLGVLISLTVLIPGLSVPGLFLAPLVMGGFCCFLLFDGDLELRYRHLGWTLLGTLYLGYLFPHVDLIYRAPQGTQWVFFIILVAAAGDTAAYFTGMALGKRKLYPEVSPGKTVEGAVGGGIASILAGLVGAMYLLPALPWFEAFLLAMAISFFAQTGDLFESWIKRVFQVKDSGTLLPGHGGLLDRVDSLIFPVVFMTYYIRLLHS